MDAFAALADPVRRALLVGVSSGPMRVVDLAATQAITRPAVSRHLRLLVEAELIDVQDHGRERHYGLRPEALDEVQRFLNRLRERRFPEPLAPGVLDALDTEVHRTQRDRRATTVRSKGISRTATRASRKDSA